MVAAACALVAGCKKYERPRQLGPPPAAKTGRTRIHEPARLTSIPAGQKDTSGRPARIACVTCHSLREPRAVPSAVRELDEFHVGLRFEHGELACAACHSGGQPPAFHLASGETLRAEEALRLCAQCHGPQHRDYVHGAHGGMTGHWDLSRGDRLKNHCVDCHDPHVPRYPGVLPAAGPRDRIAPVEKEREHG